MHGIAMVDLCTAVAEFATDRMVAVIAMCAACMKLLCVRSNELLLVGLLCNAQAAIVLSAGKLHTQSAQLEVLQKFEGLQRPHLPLSAVRTHGSISFIEHESGVRAAHIACEDDIFDIAMGILALSQLLSRATLSRCIAKRSHQQ